MLFYTKQFFLLVATIGWVAGSGFSQEPNCPTDQTTTEIQGFEGTFPALGTLVQIKCFSADPSAAETAFTKAQEDVRRLESILTDYDSASETSKLTQLAAGNATPVSAELWQVLEASDRWFRSSEGAFDSSLGALTKLWRKSRRSNSTPSQAELQSALESSGWQHVTLDRDAQSVMLTRPGIQFDFGAIGKGYIVDSIFEGFVEQNLTSCLVNISGNMRCGSAPPDRPGWRIAISPLEEDGQPLRELVINNAALATSGDLWQYQVIDGVRRSHILDPKTGMGVEGPIAATVVANTATDADALATAACVMGPTRALEFARTLENVALLVAVKPADQPVEVHETKGFPKQNPNPKR